MSKISETFAVSLNNTVYTVGKLPKAKENLLSRFNRYYMFLVSLSVVYCASILLIPPDASVLTKYGISASRSRFISMSFAMPVIIIWAAAFYGFIQLKQYAKHVQPSRDGISLARIAHGLMFLAIAMPINAVCTSLGNYIVSTRPRLTPVNMILNNYIALIFVLIGFYLISQGASGLVSLLKKRSQHSPREHLIMVAFLAVSAFYGYLTLTNPARQFPTVGVRRAAYYMADFPLVMTIIIPYLFVWFFGIRSVYYIYLYRKRVKGVLYQDSLGLLAAGLAVVIITSMFLRFLVSLTTLLNSLTLKVLLVVLYILILIIFVGYILIARGVKKLQRIEEV